MFHRSALDENREINHHGLSVSVGGKDSQADSTIISFDKNLISRDEKVQNTALKYIKKAFPQLNTNSTFLLQSQIQVSCKPKEK